MVLKTSSPHGCTERMLESWSRHTRYGIIGIIGPYDRPYGASIIWLLIGFYSFFIKKSNLMKRGSWLGPMGVIRGSSGGHPGVILGSAMENFEEEIEF